MKRASRLAGLSTFVSIFAFVGATGAVACGAGPTPANEPTSARDAAPDAEVIAPVQSNVTPATPADAGPAAAPADAGAASAPVAEALAASPPKLKLVDPGTPPRQALRYKLKAGMSETAEMDMKMATTMGGGGRIDLPTMRMTMKIDSKEVTPDGDVRCTFDTKSVDVLKDGKAPANVREALEKELKGVVGLHGKYRVSPRGVVADTDFDFGPNASDAMKQHAEGMRDALRQAYLPFPEEEVGKGAKWEVTTRMPVGGAFVDTKVEYTLTKIEADGVQADVVTTLSAPQQEMHLPNVPPSVHATLDSMSAKGNGKVSPSFTHLVSSGTNALTTDMAFTIEMGQQQQKQQMSTDLAINVHPKKK